MRRNRGLIFTLIAIVLVVLLVPVLGGSMMAWRGGHGMMGGWYERAPGGWGFGLAMGFGWLIMLAFWGAIIAGIVLLVRSVGGAGHHAHGPPAESPFDIIKRRLAAGEITPDEYERMREILAR